MKFHVLLCQPVVSCEQVATVVIFRDDCWLHPSPSYSLAKVLVAKETIARECTIKIKAKEGSANL